MDDPARAQQVTSRLATLQNDLRRIRSLRSRVDDLAVLHELSQAEDDPGALDEVGAEITALRRTIGELEVRTLLSGEYDHRDALMTIRARGRGRRRR